MILTTLIFLPIFLGAMVYLVRKTKFTKFSSLLLIFELMIILNLLMKLKDTRYIDYLIGGRGNSISISLYINSLELILLAVVFIIWLVVILYSFYRWEQDFKFYFFLHFLRGTFYAIILTNDLFNIFVLVEIISTLSAILIIYKKDGFSIRAGAYYLLFNSTGMLFYLIGMIVIYLKIGTLNLTYLSQLPMDGTTKIALALIVVSMGVKSAFFPVYNWLPKAHASAPSAISAILSGLLVKAGFIVYIKIIRYINMEMFSDYLIWIGLITAVSGFLFAMSQKDIKGILAFHTISQSGLILVGLAGTGELFIGGFLHLVNHSFFKSLLFLTIGLVINKYHIRRVYDIKGVFKKLPTVSFFIIVGILSITGFPFTNGFVSKYLIKSSLKYNAYYKYLLHFINLGTIISFIKVSTIFFGNNRNENIKEQIDQNISIGILGLVTLFSGVFEMYILEKYLSITLNIGFMDFVTYFIYVGIGYLFYKYFIKKEAKIFYQLRHYEMGFKDANILLVVFTITTILFLA